MDIEIVDNFIPPSYFSEIQRLILDSTFPWNFRGDITSSSEGGDVCEFGFNHFLFSNYENDTNFNEKSSTHFIGPAIFMIKDYVQCDQIYRSRLDMTVNVSKKFRHSPHVDLNRPNTTAILYINDSDGDTVIFNEKVDETNYPVDKNREYTVKKEISPVSNRLLVFSGDYIHTGHSPMHHKNRVLLNCNFGPFL